MTRRERAIKYASEHRSTHVAWLEYWRQNPPQTAAERRKRHIAGGITHQRECIRRYDTILRALQETA